jgi:hypothetical protein
LPVEIEVPTEHLHEAIHEAAHHESEHGGGGHAGSGSFIMGVALSSALLAVIAAVAALFAGHFANDAMLERIESGDLWAYYQSKSIKASVMQSKRSMLQALDKPTSPDDDVKIERYASEQKDIEEHAQELTAESVGHLKMHTRLAASVTFFQIAIALGAISVLTKKKPMWFGSIAVGAVGLVVMTWGFIPPAISIAEVDTKAHTVGTSKHDHEGGEHKGHGGAEKSHEAAEPATHEGATPEGVK